MRNSFIITMVLVAIVLGSLSVASNNEITVEIQDGIIQGFVEDESNIFLGIPYAKPPVDKLRWKPPTKPDRWDGILECKEYGSSCPQNSESSPFYPYVKMDTDDMDEDCLYLNIWTPNLEPEECLPVMFWIHGGGFNHGSGSQPTYNGKNLSTKGDVVVVTINYRLGVFGFFAHPLLSKEDDFGISGNYGIKDQIFALSWVKENIENFGGDPGNITIFGESAGGVSVVTLMCSEKTDGLFDKTIVQSASAVYGLPYLSKPREKMKSMEQMGVEFANNIGIKNNASSLEKLREISWGKLLKADGVKDNLVPGNASSQYLCIDGVFLKDDPANIFKKGMGAPVPMMLGTNANEGSLYVSRTGITTLKQLKYYLWMGCGKLFDEIINLYEIKNDDDIERVLEEIMTDGFITAVRSTARSHSKNENPTFLYHFTRALPSWKRVGLGAFHACELAYVWGNLNTNEFTKQDKKLSENIIKYWTNFARFGNPNGDSNPYWNTYSKETDNHLDFNLEIAEGTELRKKYCDVYELCSE